MVRMIVSSPHVYWNSNAQCDGNSRWGLGRCLSHESGIPMNGLVPYKKGQRSHLPPSTKWTVRTKHEEDPRQKTTILAPRVWTAQLPGLWSIHSRCFSVTQLVVFYYSPNELRQLMVLPTGKVRCTLQTSVTLLTAENNHWAVHIHWLFHSIHNYY